MAYLREEKEKLEVNYPLEAIWEAIPKAVDKLDWKIEKKVDATHYIEVKTKGAFISYPSVLKIELSSTDEKTSRMFLVANTPVTTITSVVDYGRTRERIDQFVSTLAKLLEAKPK